MKTWTALALLLALGVAPAKGQGRTEEPEKTASLPAEIELLELEQDVDRGLIREALVTIARSSVRRRSVSSDDKELDALKEFVEVTKHHFLARAAEIRTKRAGLVRPAGPRGASSRDQAGRPPAPSASPVDDREKQALIEKAEEAQIEVQLLQAQTQLYQQPLHEAIQSLAAAEFAAGDDKAQQEKAEAARSRFEKAKARYVGFSRKLQVEQDKLQGLQMRLNMGGMGGGFR